MISKRAFEVAQPKPAVDVERYRREGYLTAPSVFSSSELDQMRREADRLLQLCTEQAERYARRIEWEVDHLAEEHKHGMERVIRKLEPVSDLSPLFAELAYHPGLTAPVAAIFGEPVELFEDKLNLKLPGGSPYPWHQDWVCCWRAHTDDLVTCFVYLDDADATNGCLQVIPGSHIGKPIYSFKPGSRFEVDPSHVDQGKVLPVPLKAGEMIYFDSYLLHYSDLNRSRVPRRCIIYTYNPASLGKVNEGRFPPDR
ncbi:MAG TPA: phytanoyl-CoA dioxygenase family protein [Chloroflexota bacterium]|nr:phytanoyl-CoA dioxygenase family protein [Chloroflexota bacterium]